MRKLQPLNPGELGPPYLVNGFVVTRAYSPTWGRYWKVYTRQQWDAAHAAPCTYETRTKRKAVAYARRGGMLP